jgi:hypothetical protein
MSDIEPIPGSRQFMLALDEESTDGPWFQGVFVRRLGAHLKPGRLQRVDTDENSFSLDLAYSAVQGAFRAVWAQGGGYQEFDPPPKADVFTRQL